VHGVRYLTQNQMPSKTMAQSPTSAIPTFYYIVFGIIEPLITFASLLGGILDPGKVRTSYEIANVS
jgi:hypothetical protein